MATLPAFLEYNRAFGLFSLAHVPMNLDYFLLHLPTVIPDFPYLRPDGLSLSVLITSPGLLFATQADWRRPRSWWLAGATIAVLIPTLLYYGGGWLQYGYRYFLDSVPFVIALCGLAAVRKGRVGPGLARAHRVRDRRHGVRRLLGADHLMGRDRLSSVALRLVIIAGLVVFAAYLGLMADIARVLRAHLGSDAARVPTKTVPDVVVRLLARRRPELRGIMPGLGRRNRHSTAKADAVLGWRPRPGADAVVDCGRSLVERRLV